MKLCLVEGGECLPGGLEKELFPKREGQSYSRLFVASVKFVELPLRFIELVEAISKFKYCIQAFLELIVLEISYQFSKVHCLPCGNAPPNIEDLMLFWH